MDPAIRAVLKLPPDELVARWHAATHAAYDPCARGTELPDRYGPQLIGVKGEAVSTMWRRRSAPTAAR